MFCVVHATIPPTPQNNAQGFTGAFPAICLVLPPLCCGFIRLYRTACATLERLPAPGRAQPIPDTTATPGRCTGQHRPPIMIRYIRVRPCYRSMPDSAAYHRPCQPDGVSIPPTPGGLQSGTRLAARPDVLAPSTRRGSPAAGVRRAARNH